MMKPKRGFTFDNFYVYDGNRVAYLAGQKIIQFPGELFNPFYVHSGTGMGKTHLLWAIHAELSKSTNILFFTGKEVEKYLDETRDYASSLIVDDLHVVSEKYHDTILQIIDRCVADNKQLCFSGNAAPREVKSFSPKLSSRLEGGLTCDIQPPKELFLVEMIKKKSEESGIILPDDIALELAQISTGSIRTIEGMINRLVAYSSLGQMTLDLNTIRLILKEFYPRGIYSPVSSLLEELKKNATDVLQGVTEQANPRDEYKEKIYIWEMKGFDTSSLKPMVDGDLDVLAREYDGFIKKVENLVELQKEFGALDISRSPDEAMKIETMFFSPNKIDEIKALIKAIKDRNRPALKTFDDFIVGECNRNAVEIYRNTILPSLGKKFNPFVVIGRKGTGKSHLLQAICSELVKQGRTPVFCDLSLKDILSRKEAAAGDVIIIDNFSGIFKRPPEERKACFEIMADSVKQDRELIISTDSFPSDMAIAPEERIVFELGIEVKLEPPSPDVVRSYLKSRLPADEAEAIIQAGLPAPASFYELDQVLRVDKAAAAAEPVREAAPEIVPLGLPGDQEGATATPPQPVPEPAVTPAKEAGQAVEERSTADDIFALEGERNKTQPKSEAAAPEPAEVSAPPVPPAADAEETAADKFPGRSYKPLKAERLIFPEIIGELLEENF